MRILRLSLSAVLFFVLIVLGTSDDANDFCPDDPFQCSELTLKLCQSEAELGSLYREGCSAACQACEGSDDDRDAALSRGEAVELRTGFVLEEGSADERALLEAFELWLDSSGARGDGLRVGAGRVRVSHSTEFAVAPGEDGSCASYRDAAQRLVSGHRVDVAVIQSHTCKADLSELFNEHGVLHFVQSGTNIEEETGGASPGVNTWYTYLSSLDYPRLFLKKMELAGHYNLSLAWSESDPWTSLSASMLKAKLESASSLQGRIRVVHTFSWREGEAGAGAWDSMVEGIVGSGAEVLIVYARDEGPSLMNRIAEKTVPLAGVYITVSPSSPEWIALTGPNGQYVVTPAQWSPMAVSSCEVFGSVTEYVALYAERLGREPGYHEALSTFAGVVIQLALQDAASVNPANLRAALSSMSHETMMGRVRFSQDRRNIGRDPVLLQIQPECNRSTVTNQLCPPELRTSDLKLVLPEELAMSRYLEFVDWRCRLLVDDKETEECTDEELEVFRECFARYPDRIDGGECLLRLEKEAVVPWDGPREISMCQDFASASAATAALEPYTRFDETSLLFVGCGSDWFGGEDFVLDSAKSIRGNVIVKELQSSGEKLNISMPVLEEISGSLMAEGNTDAVGLHLPNLETVAGELRVSGNMGDLSVSVPKLVIVGGRFRFEDNNGTRGINLAFVEIIGSLELYRNSASDPESVINIAMPNLDRITGPFIMTNNRGIDKILFPQLKEVGEEFKLTGNEGLVEVALANLVKVSAPAIVVTANPDLAFFNLAQAKTHVEYCEAFSAGDLRGNTALLNVRTRWFEPGSCKALAGDKTANICPDGYVLVHGEGVESRCDEDWRPFFIVALLQALIGITSVALLALYQARQYSVFYCRPEFTNDMPIDPGLCGFSWHASMTTLLLSTVDTISDIIFIQVQIQDNACRDYSSIITISLWVLIGSSLVTFARSAAEVVVLMRDRRRVIHMFPRPSPQRPFNIMEWVWCATNSAVNVLLVLLCSVGMEPLRILPWDRPESSTKVELLEKAEFMPDWHRHRGLQPFNSAMSDSEDHRPKWLPSGHGLRMALIYASTLSFSDSTLAIFEDVAQFVLQIMFLMSCHPTESAALTTLLSVVFSMLRAGLKLASALSDDVVKQITRSISIYTMSSLHRFATRSARSHVAPSSAPAATEQGLSGTGNSRVMGDVRMSSEADKAFGSTPHSENNIYNLLTVQSFNNHDGREATGDLQHFPKH